MAPVGHTDGQIDHILTDMVSTEQPRVNSCSFILTPDESQIWTVTTVLLFRFMLNTPQMLETQKPLHLLRGYHVIYRVVMETPTWCCLAGSETSVSPTVSRSCRYYGSLSSHSCVLPLVGSIPNQTEKERRGCVCRGVMHTHARTQTHTYKAKAKFAEHV